MTQHDQHSLIGKRSVALVLGGGRGSRLFPLTMSRCKPAVSIGGKYRLVDIPISNCVNSGVNRIYVLTQFMSAGLNRHITRTYRFDSFGERFVEILANEQTPTNYHYAQGTADAVRHCVRYLEAMEADLVFILSGDQLCRINLNEMFAAHCASQADVTLACIGIPQDSVSRCGVVRAGPDGRITDFAEKPAAREVVEKFRRPGGGPAPFSGSMGVYLFDKKVLLGLLAEYPQEHDFGKGIFPKTIGTHRIQRYAYEGYWEDIGTIKSYFDASMGLLDERPAFSFYDFEMPVYTHHRNLPAPKVFDSGIDASLICDGSVLRGAKVRRSIVGLRTYIRPGTEVNQAIIMGNDYYPDGFFSLPAERQENSGFGWKAGVTVERAIIDKNVVIGANSVVRGSVDTNITVQNEETAKFHIINGIVVIPRGTVLPDNTVIDAETFK